MSNFILKVASFCFYCEKESQFHLKPETNIEYKTYIFIEKYIISIDNYHCLMLAKCYFTIIPGESAIIQCDFLTMLTAATLFIRWLPSHFQNGGWTLKFDIANNEKVTICTETSKIFWWPVWKWHFPCNSILIYQFHFKSSILQFPLQILHCSNHRALHIPCISDVCWKFTAGWTGHQLETSIGTISWGGVLPKSMKLWMPCQ